VIPDKIARGAKTMEMLAIIWIVIWWLIACEAVSMAAHARLGRGGFRWFLAAIFLSPLFAAILLCAYPEDYERKRDAQEAAAMAAAATPEGKAARNRGDKIAVAIFLVVAACLAVGVWFLEHGTH
jgi:hypothetical protein